MELCTVKAISKLHNHPLPLASTSSHCYLLPKPSICLRQIPITLTAGLLSRPIYLSNLLLPRATTSEESSGGSSWYVDKKKDEERDGAIFTADKTTFNETVTSEETKDESPVDDQVQPFAFLDNLNIKGMLDETSAVMSNLSGYLSNSTEHCFAIFLLVLFLHLLKEWLCFMIAELLL